jgi:predicted secreted hydrolase
LSIPSARLDLTVTPYLEDQEVLLSFTYWEGSVEVEGTLNGAPVTGEGYAELTGYSGSMQGQF